MFTGKDVIFIALTLLLVGSETMGKPTKKRCRPELVDLADSSGDDSVVLVRNKYNCYIIPTVSMIFC